MNRVDNNPWEKHTKKCEKNNLKFSLSSIVEDNLKEKSNRIPIRKEGINEAKWALLDYGEIIVNVFQPFEREYYDLEAFWSHGQRFTYKPLQTQKLITS